MARSAARTRRWRDGQARAHVYSVYTMAKPTNPHLTYGLLAGNPEAFQRVSATLRACNGNATMAAGYLGVSPRTLQRWLARWPELARARAIGWAGQ